MDISISIKDLILVLLGAGGLVLIIYLVFLVKNLITTLKSANVVLKDVETISAIAAKRAQDIDGIVDDVVDSVGTVAKNLKGKESLSKTISSAIGFLTSLKGLFSKFKKNKDEDEEE